MYSLLNNANNNAYNEKSRSPIFLKLACKIVPYVMVCANQAFAY